MNRMGYLLFRVWPKIKNIIYIVNNRLWFSIIGVRYGENMIINDKIYVKGKGSIVIGDDFTFHSGNDLNPISRNMRGYLYVPYQESKIVVGNKVGISSSCLWAKSSITIGNDVNIGGDCLIMDNDAHPHDFLKRRAFFCKEMGEDVYQQCIPAAPIEIGDDVWIGARSIILKGVKIGPRSIIAAGSVVIKSIPADCLAGGNPCRVIRKLDNNV